MAINLPNTPMPGPAAWWQARQKRGQQALQEAQTDARQTLSQAFLAGRRAKADPPAEQNHARLVMGYMTLEAAIDSVWQTVRRPRQSISQVLQKHSPVWVTQASGTDAARATRILKRLLDGSSIPDPRLNVKILQMSKPNALAAGQGHVGVTDGLMKAVRNDDELAFVLAHELAHELNRDNPGLMRLNQERLWVIKSLVQRGMGPTAAGSLYEQEVLRIQRQAESEADLAAIQLMVKAGFQPQGAISFMETLQRTEKNAPEWMPKPAANHPPTNTRIETLKAAIAKLPSKK